MTDADRIRQLEDRAEIEEIFVTYSRCLDGKDFPGYAAMFARQGVFVTPTGDLIGPDAVLEMLNEGFSDAVRGHLPPAIHVMNNQHIEIDGDTATTRVIWFYLTTDPDGVPTILQGGSYDDELVREDGRWKISRHVNTRIMGRSPMDAAPHTRLDELEQRLRVIEDKDAIYRLFIECQDRIDACDWRGYAALFTDDAVWIGNVRYAEGPAAIEQMLIDVLPVWSNDGQRTYHLLLDPVIDVDGDTATSVSRWAFLTRSATDAPVFEVFGRYEDTLVRTPDGWRYARRAAFSDIPYAESHHRTP